jgi:hypothetical protein
MSLDTLIMSSLSLVLIQLYFKYSIKKERDIYCGIFAQSKNCGVRETAVAR